MKVVCSSLLFTGLPLLDALKRIGALGFRRAELSVHYKSAWGHFLPDMVHTEPERALETAEAAVKESGVEIAAINSHFDPLAQSERGQFEAVCDFAGKLGASVVSMVANQPSEWLAANAMKDHVSIARAHGVSLCVETHRPSACHDPQSAIQLVEQVKGLKLTMDIGTLISGGHQRDSWIPLFEHTGHVHVKDSGPALDLVQVPVGDGLLDVSFLLTSLTRVGYGGALVVEYLGPRDSKEKSIDYETETVRLREILESELLDSESAS